MSLCMAVLFWFSWRLESVIAKRHETHDRRSTVMFTTVGFFKDTRTGVHAHIDAHTRQSISHVSLLIFARISSRHMAGSLPSNKSVVSYGRGRVKMQLGLTTGGAALLFLCLSTIGCAWVVNFLDTNSALTATSQAFRRTLADTLSADIASMMMPLWVLVRQAVDEMEKTRSIDGVTVMPPSLQTIHDHSIDLHTFLWGKVNIETHMQGFGCFAVLACAEEACAEGRFAHDAASCMDAVWVGSVLWVDNAWIISDFLKDHQYFVNGTGYRQVHLWDHLDGEFVSTDDFPVWNCSEAMAALWANPENMQPDFHNFSWYGPVDPGLGWESHFAGAVPVYDAKQKIIGEFSCSLAQSEGIGRILRDILEDGGDMTVGAEVAIVSTAGQVIGLSEAAASPIVDNETATLVTVSEIVGSSLTGKALSKIKDEHGTVCPAQQYLIDDDDNQRLVDVTPFRTQDWGMPPLNTDWCQDHDDTTT